MLEVGQTDRQTGRQADRQTDTCRQLEINSCCDNVVYPPTDDAANTASLSESRREPSVATVLSDLMDDPVAGRAPPGVRMLVDSAMGGSCGRMIRLCSSTTFLSSSRFFFSSSRFFISWTRNPSTNCLKQEHVVASPPHHLNMLSTGLLHTNVWRHLYVSL